MAVKSSLEDLQESLREKVIDAGVADVLIETAMGRPLPVRDIDGNIVAYQAVEPQYRLAILERLMRKIAPDLKSVDVTGAEGGAITFQVVAPFALPGSQRPSQQDAEQITSTKEEDA